MALRLSEGLRIDTVWSIDDDSRVIWSLQERLDMLACAFIVLR
jgi:hypothetical protein